MCWDENKMYQAKHNLDLSAFVAWYENKNSVLVQHASISIQVYTLK